MDRAQPHLLPASRPSPLRSAFLSALLLVCAIAPAVYANTPWHEADHTFRAEVRIGEVSAHDDIDTAAVRLEHAGHMHPAADDVRIYDEAGERVAYQVTYHTADRDALISFRTPAGEAASDKRFWIYFGHGDASRDPRRAVVNDTPGAGPPEPGPDADGWVPGAGLVLETRRRSRDHDNPMDVEALAALIAASPRPDGADYRANIADAANPFGHSYYYISLYRGWIDIPRAGAWAFCTISNDGSFSFLDGEELVHWPGRHTTERGRRGEVNVERMLDAGRYYVEYYHEDTSLHQMAFLGWRPPGRDRFEAVPDGAFVQPHRATVQRYEHRDHGRTLVPRVELIDSVWPDERADGQYTRYRLLADHGDEPIGLDGYRIEWRTGDGQRHTGAGAEHVYLAVDDYQLTATIEHPGGWSATLTRPVYVYPLEHMHEGVRVGAYEDYVPIVRSYDFDKLDGDAATEAVHLLREAGEPALARHAALRRLETEDVANDARAVLHLAAVGNAGDEQALWRGADSDADAAASISEHLAAAHAAAHLVDQLRVGARSIRHEGIARGDLAAAREHYDAAHTLWQTRAMPAGGREALRQVEVAMGDVLVHHRQLDAAREHYLNAEQLAERPAPQQVRMAHLGSYVERVRQHLDADRVDAAADELRRWRERYPASLLDGDLPYLLGRVYLLRGEPAKAVTAFELAIERGRGMPFELEAHYRLSEAHTALGDNDAARRALVRLLESDLAGPFRERARQRLDDLTTP